MADRRRSRRVQHRVPERLAADLRAAAGSLRPVARRQPRDRAVGRARLPRASASGNDGGQRLFGDLRPDDGGAPEQIPLARPQPVEPHGQEASQGRWDRLDVVILEQDICGGGASGRNGGFVLSWWPKLASLAHRFGDRRSARAGDGPNLLRPPRLRTRSRRASVSDSRGGRSVPGWRRLERWRRTGGALGFARASSAASGSTGARSSRTRAAGRYWPRST